MMREVDDEAVEAVRDRRAGRTPCRVLGPKHEVVDEQLRASPEQIGEGRRALIGREAVLLVDAEPGQLLPPPRQLVAAPRQLLFGLEQLQPGRKPLFTCSGLVIGHGFSPSCRYDSLARATDVRHHWWRESGFQADKVHTTIFEQIERFEEIFERAPQQIKLLSTRDPRWTVRLSTIPVGNGSADRKMGLPVCIPNGVKHVTI